MLRMSDYIVYRTGQFYARYERFGYYDHGVCWVSLIEMMTVLDSLSIAQRMMPHTVIARLDVSYLYGICIGLLLCLINGIRYFKYVKYTDLVERWKGETPHARTIRKRVIVAYAFLVVGGPVVVGLLRAWHWLPGPAGQ